MTALLTESKIREEALAYEESCGPRMGTYSRVNAFIAGANLARSIYEARLAEDAKVRAGLVEALEAVKASWTNNDPLRAQHILQINDALASAKLLA